MRHYELIFTDTQSYVGYPSFVTLSNEWLNVNNHNSRRLCYIRVWDSGTPLEIPK